MEFTTEALVGTALAAGAAYTLASAARPAQQRVLDAATLTLLTEGPAQPDAACQPIVEALNNAPTTDVEAVCTEQMRSILQNELLPYRSLAEDPELLLKCSEHMCAEAPGALWTRFTVSYNLYAGSVVALGSDEQRELLYQSQPSGELGCFAFTELGAGVLSGAGVETTATYNKSTDSFVIHSPTPSSRKTWISQGCQAEQAVILAELFIDEKSYGPHLFWHRIAKRNAKSGTLTTLPGVEVTSLPEKIALRGLDNAYVMFDSFEVPRSSMLSRFCSLDSEGTYTLNLPQGVKRMLDLLISRLLTGRIVLSEATVGYARALVRRSWTHCATRRLWKGRKPEGPLMSTMPLIMNGFKDYAQSLAVVAKFIADTRTKVAEAIMQDVFPPELIEATCMCKFVGTGFAVDAVSAMRKLMGSRAIQADAWLGEGSFVCNATCAAEGDNTIMELKIVQDMVRGRTPRLPFGCMARVCTNTHGRRAVRIYLALFARAMLLGKAALHEGQLLKDLAWARLHLRVLDVWLSGSNNGNDVSWLDSYARTMMVFPVPITM